MARITAAINVETDWEDDDVLRLRLGTENVADLASSTPSGGTVRLEDAVGPLADAPGSVPPRVLQDTIYPADRCAVVPLGVSIKDPAGNESLVFETFEQLRDAPRAPGSLAVAATANPSEALLTWTASPDV